MTTGATLKALMAMPLLASLAACQSSTAVQGDTCGLPPLYQASHYGRVEPTWETRAALLEQLPESSASQEVCWYIAPDNQVVAHTNRRWFHGDELKPYPPAKPPNWLRDVYKVHSFGFTEGSWVLTGSHEELVVH